MALRLALLLALIWFPNLGFADPRYKLSEESISAALTGIEADILAKHSLLEHLDDYLAKLPTYTAWAKACIARSDNNLGDIRIHLEKLGEAADDEPEDVSITRQKMLAEKTELQKTVASCKAILVRSDAAIKKISLFRKENLQRQSFDRGRSIVTVLRETLSGSRQWMATLGGALASSEGVHALGGSELVMLLSIAIIALVAGLMIRNALRRWDDHSLARWQRINLDEGDTGLRLLGALAMTTRRFVVPLLVSISIGIFIYIETFDRVPTPLITIVMDGLPLLLLAFAATFFFFKALGDLGLRDKSGSATDRSLRKRFNILAMIWFFGHLLFQSILANSLSESAFFLARSVLGVILVLNVIWIVWLSKEVEGLHFTTPVRLFISLILLSAMVAELTGYRNLSGFILRGVVGTLVAYGVFRIVSHLVHTLLDEIDTGKSAWQQRIRKKTGIKNNKSIPGFAWVRFISYVVIRLILVASLLAVWKVPETEIGLLGTYITQGFTIGSIEIVPLKILEALIILLLLLVINSWFHRRLEKKWLTMTKIERGARESIATIGNYIGIALAILVALAIVGMDFSKLAIIAGALSVGIGFGLQNIVNNFVSGLILLFERPIKTGDWIQAGGVEGHVKKISIRSTQIESFDRADIIVPNSELISGNLTNWVHKNQYGRIRIPVSVAYGSNTELVRELLTGIAYDHKEVIRDHPAMHDPKVMFMAFGDSSLDLELRFFVRNIKNRLNIISDINFAIDKTFRENGIEIPFPQRDVHIRDGIARESAGDEVADDTTTT